MDRAWHFYLFIDLAKAFDSVDRTQLIQLLTSKNVPPYLVRAIANLLANTSTVLHNSNSVIPTY